MIDLSRIRSGFDIEVLLGPTYFLEVLLAARKAGLIPKEIGADGGGAEAIPLDPPSAVRIISDPMAGHDIEVDIVAQLDNPHTVTISLGVVFTEKAVELSFRNLDAGTVYAINLYGLSIQDPNLLTTIQQELQQSLDQEVPLDLVAGDVAEVVVRKVPAEGDFQTAFALLLNLDIKIASQSQAPEEEFIERGDADLAVSFLTADRAFAIGIPNATLSRMANDVWHGFAVQYDDGNWDHPIKDGAGDKVGVYKSVAMKVHGGALKVTTRSELFLDWWPDADVTTVFEFRPSIDRKEQLVVNIKMTEFDADTGLLGDVVAFLLPGLLGSLLGFIFGPVGLIGGAAVLGSGGVVSLEITETVLEDRFGQQVENQVRRGNLASAFTAFPTKSRLFTSTSDRFYSRHDEVWSFFKGIYSSSAGMAFDGTAEARVVYETQDITIVDKHRGEGEEAWNGLFALMYRLQDGTKIRLSMEDVIHRLSLGKLERVPLDPVGIRRRRSKISSICFKSGLELRTEEMVALQQAAIAYLRGFQLIVPKAAGRKPYYRAKPDGKESNNFSALPLC